MPGRDQLLATTDWVEAHLDDPGLRIIESTVFLRPRPDDAPGYQVEPGLDEFRAGHIPGAVFADIPGELSDRASSLPFMMPPAEQFASAMERYGVGDDSHVVLYDRAGNMWAARLWWMLRAFGFENARVLDGGWAKWSSEGRAASTDTTDPPPATFTAKLRPELIAGTDEVLASIESGQACIVNALNAAQHRGEVQAYARPGHIAGSVNVPATGSGGIVDPETMTYQDTATIRALFEDAGAKPGERMITYCGGGIAASSTAFAAILAGYTNVAVYDASLSEWAADAALPMEVA